MTGDGPIIEGAGGGPGGYVSRTHPSAPGEGHIPVMLREVLAALEPGSGQLFLDATFGAGGYSRALLDAAPGIRVLALDRDPNAIAAGGAMAEAHLGRLILAQTPFSQMRDAATEAGFDRFDGIVMDIGVSSMQLDLASRGFSFRQDGPLDMRMSQSGPSAADLVNSLSEAALADILFHYGEERLSRPIARAIVADRDANPFTSTRQLADLIGRIVRHKPGEIHPATRSFQGLRIAVNDELGELAKALHAAEALLKPGGRLVIVSFHSLEDRIAKVFLAGRAGRGGASRHAPIAQEAAPSFRITGKWPRIASEEERAANPRARSAKLRAALRNASPPMPRDEAVFALASLPDRGKTGALRKGRR